MLLPGPGVAIPASALKTEGSSAPVSPDWAYVLSPGTLALCQPDGGHAGRFAHSVELRAWEGLGQPAPGEGAAWGLGLQE